MKQNVPFVIFFLILAGCSGNGTGGTGVKDEPLEYQLAVIHAKGYVPEDDITVARFRSLLKQLSSLYVEDRQRIADMTVKAQQLLREEGVDESPLNIMEGMNQLHAGKVENQTYSGQLALYMGLWTKGYSHAEAIEALRGIIQEMGIP